MFYGINNERLERLLFVFTTLSFFLQGLIILSGLAVVYGILSVIF